MQKLAVSDRLLPLLLALSILFVTTPSSAGTNLVIVVEREPPQGKLLPGRITVDGQILGQTYENAETQILPGEYKGVLRYVSGKNFVQGPMGVLAQKGDFLLEVSGPAGRTDILLHGGNKAFQSKGCILLGPVGRDPSTLEPTVGPDHPLRKLRKAFYGTDDPTATPDKNVLITVK